MNIFSNNVIGSVVASIVAGGLVLGVGSIVNNSIEQQVNPGQKNSVYSTPSYKPTTTTPIPKLENKPAVMGVNTNRQIPKESDPIVNCEYPHVGTLPVKQSECAGTKTECEVAPGKWQVVWTTECNALYAKNNTAAVPSPATASKEKLIDCVFDDSWGKSHEYKQVTEKRCAESKKIWTSSSSSSSVTVPSLAPFKANCYVGNQVIPNLTTEECTKRMQQYSNDQKAIADLERQHQEQCNQAYADWRTTKGEFYSTYANDFSSSGEAMRYLAGLMQQYQAEMRAAGCTQTLSL